MIIKIIEKHGALIASWKIIEYDQDGPNLRLKAEFEFMDGSRFFVRQVFLKVNENGRYVLVEFPFMTVPHGAREMLFQMKQKGLTPILAHPERNAAIQRNIETYKKNI